MPWYKVKDKLNNLEYRHSHSFSALLFEYVKKQQWHIYISRWKIKKLDYKALLTFYEEIQNALLSGLQLNQSISHLTQSPLNPNLSKISKALLNELEKGANLNVLLAKLTTRTASPYCYLLNAQGSREDCEKSLQISIMQITLLLSWSQRLLKAVAYPFSIIQISLVILITNRTLQSTEVANIALLKDMALYISCSSIQLLTLYHLHKGNACHWLERFSYSFRLMKLFSLLTSAKSTGISLQNALKNMPNYFSHKAMKIEILDTYYQLRLGNSYHDSFPKSWFPRDSAMALHSAEQNGDLERALRLAATSHDQHWQKNIALFEKLIPVFCLLIAGGFVASALISLYSPLLMVQK